ncbi:MAG: PG0541 family transporter-associated protein [Sediminispirochaetaceae bacterium]
MKRIEIIANRSIEEDMFEAFAKAEVAKHYTKIPEVMGAGNSGPRMGDHVWPEENFILIVYCEEPEAEKIKEVIGELKEFFKGEGIKLFEISV